MLEFTFLCLFHLGGQAARAWLRFVYSFRPFQTRQLLAAPPRSIFFLYLVISGIRGSSGEAFLQVACNCLFALQY
jgi:hypothetical protein